MYDWDYGGHMGFGGFGMVLWWGLFIAGIVLLAKWLGNDRCRSRPDKSALDILKERYARGEIEQAEFEQKRRELEH